MTSILRPLTSMSGTILLASCLLWTPVSTFAANETILARSNTISSGGPIELGGVRIVATEFIGKFYDLRQGRPAWFGQPAAADLLSELRQALTQGFLPGDFHLPELLDLHETAETGTDEDVAVFEIAATDAAARLVHHIIFGKVDPSTLDSAFNFDRPVIERDAEVVISEYVDGAGFSALMDELAVDNAAYLQLVDALATYREIDTLGGWPEIAEGAPLKAGAVDDRVPMLRERLAVSGDLPLDDLKKAEAEEAEAVAAAVASSGQPVNNDTAETADGAASSDGEAVVTEEPENTVNLYDEALLAAVKRFQERHGLDADGVIGPQTLTALNRSAGDRADQLRLSLERFRWYVRELERDYALVNIGGADMVLVLNGEEAWRTRTITGSEYRQTPVFKDAIQYMEFNPTWSVPASIFQKDKLDRIRKDRGYLDRNNYVVRNSNGDVIPASSVNWGAKNPGVSLMQKPGPDNALGLVKFMFPNEYAVYLHDTNDRSLFDRAGRNLSSGCVRVEDPFVFAGLLMRDDPSWTQERMNAILESGKTTRIELPKPIPVMLTYWTAWVEDDGNVHFREDTYERDGPILEKLNAPL